MRKELSTILISLILLLSPVSFSSEAIPDFTPECSVTSIYTANISVAPLDGTTYDHILSPQPEIQEYTTTPIFITSIDRASTALFGRAPPA
jgi:hypothetical protein